MTNWTVKSERTILDIPPFLSVSVQSVALPDGRVVDDYYQVDLKQFALIVPVLEDGRILLIEQYKHGPRRSSLTFPAGLIDPGETPLVAAKRELLEETGYVAQDWISLGAYVENGNQRGAEGHFFLARGAVSKQEPDSGDLEEMHLVDMTAEAVDQAMLDGAFAIMPNVAAWGLTRLTLGSDPQR